MLCRCLRGERSVLGLSPVGGGSCNQWLRHHAVSRIALCSCHAVCACCGCWAIHSLPTVMGTRALWMSRRTHGCALTPRMASGQSANPCWCVACCGREVAWCVRVSRTFVHHLRQILKFCPQQDSVVCNVSIDGCDLSIVPTLCHKLCSN